MHLRKALLVKVKLQNMLYAKFIEVIAYSKWVSNPIIIPKPDGCIWICTNFRDVNKAYPKDDFPLPNIDALVDNIADHEMFSFMDDFFGYNQIIIVEEDKHNMVFTTP